MQQPFHMFELTRKMVLEISENMAKPHRHEYEELLIISRGNPEHFTDFIRETVSAPVVIYVAQGRVHEFLPDPDTRGWCIRYQNDFIPESNFHYYSNYLDRITFPFDPGTCRQQIGMLCELILYEYLQNSASHHVYRHLFIALLAKLDAEGKHDFPAEMERRSPRQEAFRSFLNILENNYTRYEGVGFYADKMNTSVRNLNHLCSRVFGKSVSEIIEARKLIEARRMMLNSELTVSEIGFALGYNEKSYFSRVFRKHTGLTPTAYRSKMYA